MATAKGVEGMGGRMGGEKGAVMTADTDNTINTINKTIDLNRSNHVLVSEWVGFTWHLA